MGLHGGCKACMDQKNALELVRLQAHGTCLGCLEEEDGKTVGTAELGALAVSILA